MQSITLLLIFHDTCVGGTELCLVESVTEALGSLVDFLLYLLVVLSQLVLNQHIGTIALLRVAVVYQRVVEGIHMSAGLPGRRVHEDGCVDAHDILVQQHHGLPPVLFDIILQFHAVLPIVVHCAQSVVDVTAGEYEAILLAVGNYLLEYIVLLCHVFYIF